MANPEPLFPDSAAPPWMLQQAAADEYDHWSRLVAKGGHLGFPWHVLDSIVGPLLPGWLVLVGARAKGGKSTLIRALFDTWVQDFKKKILLVGTEQNAGILRALWACLRLRLPTEAAIDALHPDHARVRQDVRNGQCSEDLENRAIIVAEPSITIDTFTQWCRVAYREQCEVVMFDHFHRLEDEGTSQHRSRNAAIRQIKNVAAKSNMLVVVAAQLKNASDDPLGEFEVPGAASWAETAGLRRECDVAIQCWRPFKLGTSRADKAEARDNPAKLADIVQQNIMAVRCDAHRYRDVAPYRAARLHVQDGDVSSWTPREEQGS